jgi:hypothetical protein
METTMRSLGRNEKAPGIRAALSVMQFLSKR